MKLVIEICKLTEIMFTFTCALICFVKSVKSFTVSLDRFDVDSNFLSYPGSLSPV